MDEARYGPAIDGRLTPHRTELHPGNDHCAKCHRQVAEAWEVTHHAFAWRALERVGGARSPECVTCHSTGFDPEGDTGWSKMTEVRGHENVGCTACHMPGEGEGMPDHPWGPSEGRGCESCHTAHTSPHFHLEAALQKVDCRKVVSWMKRRRAQEQWLREQEGN
jgi:predicted CXXCH cytochrome family protein